MTYTADSCSDSAPGLGLCFLASDTRRHGREMGVERLAMGGGLGNITGRGRSRLARFCGWQVHNVDSGNKSRVRIWYMFLY